MVPLLLLSALVVGDSGSASAAVTTRTVQDRPLVWKGMTFGEVSKALGETAIVLGGNARCIIAEYPKANLLVFYEVATWRVKGVRRLRP